MNTQSSWAVIKFAGEIKFYDVEFRSALRFKFNATPRHKPHAPQIARYKTKIEISEFYNGAKFALLRRFIKFLIFKFKPAQIESVFYSAKIPLVREI